MQLYTVLTSFCQTNTYIIIEGNDAIVIDPGASGERIVKFIAEHNAAPKFVLVTHAHFDHTGAVAYLQQSGALVYISDKDYRLLTENDFAVDLGCICESVKPFDADVLLYDGDEFGICDHNFKVVETPGHTPGGVCFIVDGKYIFSGDTLFRASIGRSDFAFCSHSDLIRSVKKLFALDGDYSVYPGHGESTTLDYERKNNPYVG